MNANATMTHMNSTGDHDPTGCFPNDRPPSIAARCRAARGVRGGGGPRGMGARKVHRLRCDEPSRPAGFACGAALVAVLLTGAPALPGASALAFAQSEASSSIAISAEPVNASNQDQEKDKDEEKDQEAQPDDQAAGDDEAEGDAGEPLSLDELLEIAEEGGDAGGDEAGIGDVRDELSPENQPAGPPISQLFLEAMEAMGQSASRLSEERDPGLVTQRHQEEALRKLATLIDQATRQQQQQQQQNQQQDQKPGRPEDPQQGQQQQQQGRQAGEQAATRDSRPGRREAELEGEIEETRLEWGSLPERIRELLLQGRNDAPASLYKRLTELYYQRLAEESEEGEPE